MPDPSHSERDAGSATPPPSATDAGERGRADVNDPAVNGQYVDQRNAWWRDDADWWSGFATEMAGLPNPADSGGSAS